MEVIDQRDRRAREQRQIEHDVQAEDVEEREHTERDIGRFDAQPGVTLQLFQIREQRSVREHRGLRRTGRARGEQQHREVVGAARDRRTSVLRVAHLGVDHQHRWRGGGARRSSSGAIGVFRRRDQQRGRGDLQLTRELVRGRRGIERHGCPARRKGPEIRRHERGLVAREQRDAIPHVDAGREQIACRARARAASSPWLTGSPAPTSAGRSGVVAAAPSRAATRFIGPGGYAGSRARSVATKCENSCSSIAPCVSLCCVQDRGSRSCERAVWSSPGNPRGPPHTQPPSPPHQRPQSRPGSPVLSSLPPPC